MIKIFISANIVQTHFGGKKPANICMNTGICKVSFLGLKLRGKINTIHFNLQLNVPLKDTVFKLYPNCHGKINIHILSVNTREIINLFFIKACLALEENKWLTFIESRRFEYFVCVNWILTGTPREELLN